MSICISAQELDLKSLEKLSKHAASKKFYKVLQKLEAVLDVVLSCPVTSLQLVTL